VGVAYWPSARPTAHDVDEYWAPAIDPGYLRALLAIVREVDWRPIDPQLLRALTVPLLVVFGTADRVVSPRELDRLLAAVPHARTVLLPGVGHAVQEVAPDAVNRALIDFLKA
jgi:pimeloyl-ACP methyl ester carboxylesterase